MTLLKLKSYTIEKFPDDARFAIWGQFEPNMLCKICILQKPKWMDDSKFEALVKHLRLDGVTEDFFEDGFDVENNRKSN